jgi:hypothetical protein
VLTGIFKKEEEEIMKKWGEEEYKERGVRQGEAEEEGEH